MLRSLVRKTVLAQEVADLIHLAAEAKHDHV